ncbi:MAG: SPFH domain-containing protein [Erysipelotrichaceae bacterium]|jgi:membrane protease subunit (stomatin/prohibitin family)
MGLIRAGLRAVSSTMKDQWKEYFYCEGLDDDVLVVKGTKQVSGLFAGNRGSDNIISNGSGIVVNEGQCMIIVDNGQVVEVCAEPGEFTYESSTSPSLFHGDLGDAIMGTLETIKNRFEMGGEIGKDQRVYYFNTKELMDNKFGTPNPIMFRVVDSKVGLDIDVSIRMAGVYSYRIADPVLFYTNVTGNVANVFTRDEIDNQLKSEFLSALQPAVGKLSALELRPNEIVNHNLELEQYLNQALSAKWGQLRGLEVVNVAISTVTLPEEDAKAIKDAQFESRYANEDLARGAMVEAMKDAAKNPGGAMTGIVGMGAIGGAAEGLAGLFKGGKKETADGWTCSCGKVNDGKFCSNCGKSKPETGWTCSCGTVNDGNFCSNCGNKKPE